MKKEVIQKMIDGYLHECSGSVAGIAEYVAHQIAREQKVLADLRAVGSRLYRENERHEMEVKKLESEIDAIREDCLHWEVEHFGDPSGGSGSFRKCATCGKEW
jgi:hypothetical protein